MPIEWHDLGDGVVIFERDADGTLHSDRCIKWEDRCLTLGVSVGVLDGIVTVPSQG